MYTGEIEVTITDPQSQFHPKAEYLQFRAIAVLPDFDGGYAEVVSSEAVLIQRDQRIDAFCLTLPVHTPGASVVVLEAIACFNDGGSIVFSYSQRFNAADIIAIVPEAKSRAAKTGYDLPRADAPPASPAVPRVTPTSPG